MNAPRNMQYRELVSFCEKMQKDVRYSDRAFAPLDKKNENDSDMHPQLTMHFFLVKWAFDAMSALMHLGFYAQQKKRSLNVSAKTKPHGLLPRQTREYSSV